MYPELMCGDCCARAIVAQPDKTIAVNRKRHGIVIIVVLIRFTLLFRSRGSFDLFRLFGSITARIRFQKRMFLSNLLKKFRKEKEKPRPWRLALGEYGERLVTEYLKRRGYRIVATNFTAPIGHGKDGRQITGEIDIVAYDESARPFTLAFIEVKTRSSDEIAQPEAAVDLRNQRQIIRTARVYRRITEVSEEPYRYDVASVLVKSSATPSVTWRRGYFSEQRFSRSRNLLREFH